METVNEKSTAVIRMWFYNQDRVPAIPTSVSYTLHDESTGDVIISSTVALTMDYTIDIYIDAVYNTIVNNARNYETKVLTVAWDFGGGISGYVEYKYRVKNLSQVS